jgi:hypothetical protein
MHQVSLVFLEGVEATGALPAKGAAGHVICAVQVAVVAYRENSKSTDISLPLVAPTVFNFASTGPH